MPGFDSQLWLLTIFLSVDPKRWPRWLKLLPCQVKDTGSVPALGFRLGPGPQKVSAKWSRGQTFTLSANTLMNRKSVITFQKRKNNTDPKPKSQGTMRKHVELTGNFAAWQHWISPYRPHQGWHTSENILSSHRVHMHQWSGSLQTPTTGLFTTDTNNVTRRQLTGAPKIRGWQCRVFHLRRKYKVWQTSAPHSPALIN